MNRTPGPAPVIARTLAAAVVFTATACGATGTSGSPHVTAPTSAAAKADRDRGDGQAHGPDCAAAHHRGTDGGRGPVHIGAPATSAQAHARPRRAAPWNLTTPWSQPARWVQPATWRPPAAGRFTTTGMPPAPRRGTAARLIRDAGWCSPRTAKPLRKGRSRPGPRPYRRAAGGRRVPSTGDRRRRPGWASAAVRSSSACTECALTTASQYGQAAAMPPASGW